jgi:protein-export membrane protein SecD
MLRFQPWKTWLVILTCLFGVVFTIPNFISRATLDTLPHWIPTPQFNLGLDLQGGSHLLYEVDMASLAKERLAGVQDAVRTQLLKEKIGFTGVGIEGDHVTVTLRDPADADKLPALVHKADADLQIANTGPGTAIVSFTEAALIKRRNDILDQSIEVIRRRIDETGTKEPSLQRQGDDQILLQLPGIDNPEQVKKIVNTTAKMTFRLLDEEGDLAAAQAGRIPPGDDYLPSVEGQRGQAFYLVRKRVMVDGADLTKASAGFDQNNAPDIQFQFNSVGGHRFGEVTAQNIGKRFAIILDNKVISAPVIQGAITGGSGIITGSFTTEEANNLALLLRAGALPATLKIIEERTVGPDLGADSIRAGAIAGMIAMALVILFMITFYGLFGVFADIALAFNLCLLLAALSILGATLTLPGIAGIALTMGMAVDANVLVNERIREEMRAGRGVIGSIDAGFTKAYATIIDANVTHFIAGVFLFELGAGPVKGFAVTLCLGILTSLFTTMMVTRLMVVWWLKGRPKALPII